MDFEDRFALIAIRFAPHWIENPDVRTAHRKVTFQLPCQARPAVFRREDFDNEKGRRGEHLLSGSARYTATSGTLNRVGATRMRTSGKIEIPGTRLSSI